MTLQQMEYIVALDAHRNFVLAAEACNVTQPTLSAMVKKLEDELGVPLFERSRKGVVPTAIGKKVIAQAQATVLDARKMAQIVQDEMGSVTGTVRIAAVPTVAPYIIPDFIYHFTRLYPQVKLQMMEMKGSLMMNGLRRGGIDLGIGTASPQTEGLSEIQLYKELFYAYFSERCLEDCPENLAMMEGGKLSLAKMDLNRMWVLREGHCMHTEDFSFCMDHAGSRDIYKAGSISTLVRIVDRNGGFTVIPELHLPLLEGFQRQNVHPLAEGARASRTVSMFLREDEVRERMVNAVAGIIRKTVPASMHCAALRRKHIKLI